MYKRNVSEFLIKAVESNFISAHGYEYIVCSFVNYNHYDFKEGSAIGGYEVEEELDKYEDSYGLDVGGRAAWKRDMEKHQLILLIDSEGFRIKFEITLDELREVERIGGYKSKPGGKGADWVIHPPGCECDKCTGCNTKPLQDLILGIV